MMPVDWSKINHFRPYETECRCGCGKNDVTHELMEDMDKFRNKVNRPVHFHSVCRCERHNRDEGGAFDSSHKKNPTEAVDIEAKTMRHRYQTLEFLILEGYNRIGIAKTFIHGDKDEAKTQEISWLY